MMKKIIILTLALCLSQALFSKVLIVRRFGYGGAFWNIEQAVDSASEGDTVYLDLQGDINNTYLWSGSRINKRIILTSSDSNGIIPTLSITSNEFQLVDLKLTNIHFSGRELRIENCKNHFNVYLNKGKLLINNSYLDNLSFLDSVSNLSIYNSEFKGVINVFSKKLIFCGNKFNSVWSITDELVFNGNTFEDTISSNLIKIKTDKISFVGNFLKSNSNLSLLFEANNGSISNNFFINKSSSFQSFPKFSITGLNNVFIVNNFFDFFVYSYSSYGGNFNIYCNPDSLFLFQLQQPSFISNLFIYDFSGNCAMSAINKLDGFGVNNVYISRDISAQYQGQYYPFSTRINYLNYVDKENFYYDYSLLKIFIDSNFYLMPDSILINRGHDDPAFSDLDLSRNDIGPLGGPTPITNYQNPGGSPKPQIWDVTLPRRTFSPSGPIPIKAVGTAK